MVVEAVEKARMVDQAFSLFRDAGLAVDRDIVGGFLAQCEVVRVDEESVELMYRHQTTKSYDVCHPVKLAIDPADGALQLYLDYGYRRSRVWSPIMTRVKEIKFYPHWNIYTFKGQGDNRPQVVFFEALEN